MRTRSARLLLAGACAAFLSRGPVSAAAPVEFRWVVAKEHGSDALARDAADRLKRAEGGYLAAEVLSTAEYSARYNGGRPMVTANVLKALLVGEIEVCQIPSYLAGSLSPPLLALDLPFMFDDFEHAERVFDGPVGRRLGEGITNSSGARGLAFSHSGYGLIATKSREVRGLADFRGLRINSSRRPVADVLSKIYRLEPSITPPEGYVPLAEADLLDGSETTAVRFMSTRDYRQAKFAVDTRHYLATSVILVNERFFQRLPAAARGELEKAVRGAAAADRRRAAADDAKARAEMKAQGVLWIELDADARRALQMAARGYHSNAKERAGTEILRALQGESTRAKGAGPSVER
ncbi:MAG: TRAP transporter substrate-binding protein DctP [Elusimicrobia bacterium]|nr:TRAP transporter substrate-binding protein DctP [Elusimicrobiota bacterium]